jgi:hypothetical protein
MQYIWSKDCASSQVESGRQHDDDDDSAGQHDDDDSDGRPQAVDSAGQHDDDGPHAGE